MTKIIIEVHTIGGMPFSYNTFLREFDHEAFYGRGMATLTDDKSEAMVFDNIEAAFEFWKRVPKNKPVREDGKPNRPLTASTILFVKVDK